MCFFLGDRGTRCSNVFFVLEGISLQDPLHRSPRNYTEVEDLEFCLDLFPIVLVRVTIAVMKHHDQRNLGGEGLFGLRFWHVACSM